VPGQSFDVTNLPNGRYYIRIDVNPTGLLKEASTANNTELRAVDVRGPKGRRRAVARPWHGIWD
jgi:lysyl oxidase